MLVGVPREIKDNEYRVGIVPSTVRELADKGQSCARPRLRLNHDLMATLYSAAPN